MRCLVIALMIVLLPLRAWAGDVMATQMATVAVTTEPRTAHAQDMGNTAIFDHQKQLTPDCHEALPGQPDNGKTTSHEADSNHCGTCLVCQACHTVALLPALLEVPTVLTSPQQCLARTVFTSAAAALGQKPPIA